MVNWQRGGSGSCCVKLIDMGLGADLQPREGTPEAALAHPTEQQLLEYYEHRVDCAFGSKTTVAPEIVLEKRIGPLYDQFGSSYAMLTMLYGPPLMCAPLPGPLLGSQLRQHFVELYTSREVGYRRRHLMGDWARTKLRMPPMTTDVYIFALAMGLSADPTLRPWYRETQRVATTLQWSAGVRAALLDPNQPAHRDADQLLPTFDALFALSAIQALTPCFPKMSRAEREAVQWMAEGAAQLFIDGFAPACNALGGYNGGAGQEQSDVPVSPTKRRRLDEGAPAAAPSTALVMPLGFKPSFEDQDLCMLGSSSKLVQLVPSLPHNPSCINDEAIGELLQEVKAALDGEELQQRSTYVKQMLEASLRTERSLWPSNNCWEANLRAFDSMTSPWLDTDAVVRFSIDGTIELLKETSLSGWLPSDAVAGAFRDSVDSALRLVLGVDHQLVLPDNPQDAVQAECAMDVHDMLQCLSPEVQLAVLELLLEQDSSLLRNFVAPSKLVETKRYQSARPKSLHALWRKGKQRLFGGKAADAALEAAAPMKTRADGQSLLLLLATCHSQYAHLLRMEAAGKLSLHQKLLERLRHNCEVALLMDRTLSAPRLAALLSFAAAEAQRLWQELGPLRWGARLLQHNDAQQRTAQAGLPQQGGHTAGRAATVAQAARTTTASKSLTVSAAMRRAIDTLLLPRLKGDGAELLTESWEYAASCKAVCTHLTGSEHGGSLLPASNGLRSWGDLL